MIFSFAYLLLCATLSSCVATFLVARKFKPATRRSLRIERRMSSTTVYLGIASIITFVCALTFV